MSEVNSIARINAGTESNLKTNKTSNASSTSFSSFLGESKDLDAIFQKAADKYNVPVNLLKAIGKAESDFRPTVVSGCGAQGIMQLMPKTAEYLGVKDAFDPEQNIMGGAKYIKELLDKYDGNTNLALAAYNAGMNNVKKYGGIPPFKETQDYVVKVNKYMNQNIQAGSVKVNSTSQNQDTATKPSVPVMATRVPDWFIAPSETTKQEDSTDLNDLLASIFSYDDYLRLLDLFYREEDDKKNSIF